jgi:hypothetical protein
MFRDGSAVCQGIGDNVRRLLVAGAGLVEGKTPEKVFASTAESARQLQDLSNAIVLPIKSRDSNRAVEKTFHSTAPSITVIHQAEAAVAQANQRVSTAFSSNPKDLPTAELQLTSARSDEAYVKEQRAAAITKAAADAAAEAGKLSGSVPTPSLYVSGHGRTIVPPAPGTSGGSPAPRAPGPAAGRAAAPAPGTHAAGAPGAASANPSASPMNGLGQAIPRMPQVPMQQVPQQMPQQPAALSQPQLGKKDDRAKALDADALTAAGIIPGAGTSHPARGGGGTLASQAAPKPPLATGTSFTGGITGAGVTGRPDGAKTILSAAEPANTKMAPAVDPNAAAQQGMPQPCLPGMGGTAGAAGRRRSPEELIRKYKSTRPPYPGSEDLAELHGWYTKVIEAVRGGTIAQRDPDSPA